MQRPITWSLAALAGLYAAGAPRGAPRAAEPPAPQVESQADDRDQGHVVRLGPATGYRLLDLTWHDGPLPGSKVAVLAGDPKTGMHHTYLQLADGARIPPHRHSTDEYATVVQGTVLFAHGENFDTTAGRLFGPGSFVFIPAGTPHYAWAKGHVVLSQTRSGAADFQWVHPEDDPARKKEAAAEAGKP